MPVRSAVLVVLLCGCGPVYSSVPDSGAGGSGAAGGGSATGGSGVPGVYAYATATLSDTVDAGRVMAISGTANNLFAASDFGNLYRSTDGMQFNLVLNAGQLLGVYVAPDGAVFLSGAAGLGVCRTPPCITAGAFTWSRPPGAASDTEYLDLCGDAANNVYAVGLLADFNGTGVVTRYDGTGWAAEQMLGLTNVRSCWLESSVTLWAAGVGQVVQWSGSIAALQGADLTALGQFASVQQWFAVVGISNTLHAVGWQESIMSRTAGGDWSLTLNHSSLSMPLWFRAVAGLKADEVFAAGTPPSCSGCGNRVWRWNGTQWNSVTPLPLLGEVRSALSVQPDVIYFGGQVDGPMDRAAIIRAVRQ